MDGESYNYANENDEAHINLDSNPPKKQDYNMRKAIGNKWQSPSVSDYKWRYIDNEQDEYTKKGD